MGNFSLRTKETIGDRVEGESSWLQLTIVSKQGSSLSQIVSIFKSVSPIPTDSISLKCSSCLVRGSL